MLDEKRIYETLLGARCALAVGEMTAVIARLVLSCSDPDAIVWAASEVRRINDAIKASMDAFTETEVS